MNSETADSSVVSQSYLVFERLLDEGSGWSCKCLKKHGSDFNTVRFPNLKGFYFMELNIVGMQVYRSDDANPVSAILHPYAFVVGDIVMVALGTLDIAMAVGCTRKRKPWFRSTALSPI